MGSRRRVRGRKRDHAAQACGCALDVRDRPAVGEHARLRRDDRGPDDGRGGAREAVGGAAGRRRRRRVGPRSCTRSARRRVVLARRRVAGGRRGCRPRRQRDVGSRRGGRRAAEGQTLVDLPYPRLRDGGRGACGGRTRLRRARRPRRAGSGVVRDLDRRARAGRRDAARGSLGRARVTAYRSCR